MGFFDWLSRPRSHVEQADDCIWLTKQAKLAGIAKAVSDCFANPQEKPALAVILVAHFEECLGELQKAIEAIPIAGPVTTTLAEHLKNIPATRQALAESETIDIIVGERHPLRAHDEAVSEFARSLSCRCRLVFHVSLEDGLMKIFAGEWVQQTLRQMGLREDEVIRSRMVARRLAGAQQKVAAAVTSDLPARSAHEWIQKNSIDGTNR